MRKRFTDAFIAVVMGAAVTLTTTAQQPARQGGAAARPSPGPPPRGPGAVGWTVVEGRQPQDQIESPAVRT